MNMVTRVMTSCHLSPYEFKIYAKNEIVSQEGIQIFQRLIDRKENLKKKKIICYECKKYEHFKLECPRLEKENHKRKAFTGMREIKI